MILNKNNWKIIKDEIDSLIGDKWILAGSGVLALTANIDREINDIDVITYDNFYNNPTLHHGVNKNLLNYRCSDEATSGRFLGPDLYIISSFSVASKKLPIKIDFFYHGECRAENLSVYDLNMDDTIIKVQSVASIIAYKMQRFEYNLSDPDQKHWNDIIFLSKNPLYKEYIIEYYRKMGLDIPRFFM